MSRALELDQLPKPKILTPFRWKNDLVRKKAFSLASQRLNFARPGSLIIVNPFKTTDEAYLNCHYLLGNGKKIYAKATKEFAVGACGRAFYLEDEKGNPYVGKQTKERGTLEDEIECAIGTDLGTISEYFTSSDQRLWIISPYFGVDLKQYLSANPALDDNARLTLAIKCALAVYELHTGILSLTGETLCTLRFKTCEFCYRS